MKVLFRPNSGGLAESMKEVKEFNSLKELLEYLVVNQNGAFAIGDISIRYYTYDERIDWETYMVHRAKIIGENY